MRILGFNGTFWIHVPYPQFQVPLYSPALPQPEVALKGGENTNSLDLFMELKQFSRALRISTNTPVVEAVTSTLPQSSYHYTLVTLPLYLVAIDGLIVSQFACAVTQNPFLFSMHTAGLHIIFSNYCTSIILVTNSCSSQ